MTMGSSFVATCAQLDASVVEQPAATEFCPGARGFLTGGSCALTGNSDTAKQTRHKMLHARTRIRYRRPVDKARERRWSQVRALPRPQPSREPPLGKTSCRFIDFAPPYDNYSRESLPVADYNATAKFPFTLQIQTLAPFSSIPHSPVPIARPLPGFLALSARMDLGAFTPARSFGFAQYLQKCMKTKGFKRV